MNWDTAVLDEQGEAVGHVVRWNPHGFGEAIVQYNDGSADSALFSELRLRDRDAVRAYLTSREP